LNGNQEQLIESMIKMVGRANQKVDSLQKRIAQLEWLFKEQELELKERGPIRIYSTLPPSETSSKTH
jgi:peptidoglycan hydrolase CwlO-like protein